MFLIDHFEYFSRGVFNTKDLVFFLCHFLLVVYRTRRLIVQRRHYHEINEHTPHSFGDRDYRIGSCAFVCIFVYPEVPTASYTMGALLITSIVALSIANKKCYKKRLNQKISSMAHEMRW